LEPIPYQDALVRLAQEERGAGWLVYCEGRGVYQWPTVEWLDALASALIPLGAERPLEVGAGDGWLGRGLRERGLSIALTDPNRKGDVEGLGVSEALNSHQPDLVISCWLPIDLGAEKWIFLYPNVLWYLAIVQAGPGFLGNETLWQDHGWEAQRLDEVNRWSVSRSDYLSDVDKGEHIRHGEAFLFSRKN
jgi:hypothetical protein